MFHVFEYPSDEHERTSYGAKAICETCGARVESNNGDVKLHRSPGYAETSAINHWNTRANECDSDELLNIADDIDRIADNASTDSIGAFLHVSTIRPASIKAVADHIRKALGVE